MQLEMFNNLSPHYDGGLECNDCGIRQPVKNFQHMPAGEIKRKCVACRKKHNEVLRYLKSIHSYPEKDYVCPICNRDIKGISRKGQKMLQSWVLDHCHETEEFRSWLCGNCNTGLGAFKDNLERVSRAKLYLEGHLKK